jgi:hypothetical protein
MSLNMNIIVCGTEVASVSGIPYREGMNVQQALEAAYDADPGERQVLDYRLQYFGASLGYELVAIDAISSQAGGDGASWLFWELLINGQWSSTGIDQTFPADGDTIGFSYTTYVTERHAGSRYEQLHAAVRGS